MYCLTGGNSSQVPTLLPLLPPIFHGDPRDYAWGADGLDNAITQVSNEYPSMHYLTVRFLIVS